MNAEILIRETIEKAKKIRLNGVFGEIITFVHQFQAAYELCEGDEDEIEDLKDLKGYLENVYDDTLEILKELKKLGGN